MLKYMGKTLGEKSHQFPTSQKPRYLQVTIQVTEYTERIFFSILQKVSTIYDYSECY